MPQTIANQLAEGSTYNDVRRKMLICRDTIRCSLRGAASAGQFGECRAKVRFCRVTFSRFRRSRRSSSPPRQYRARWGPRMHGQGNVDEQIR